MEKITVEIKHDGVLRERWTMDPNTWSNIRKTLDPILHDLENLYCKKKEEGEEDG